MDWLKKHSDTVIVLGTLFSGFLWVNGKFNDIDRRLNEIEKNLMKIETILYLKGILPQEFLSKHEKSE